MMISRSLGKWPVFALIALVLSLSTVGLAQTKSETEKKVSPLTASERTEFAFGDSSLRRSVRELPAMISEGRNNRSNRTFGSTETAKSPVRPKQTTSGSSWEFAFSPYLYMTGIEGDVGARGRVTNIDLSFGDIMSNFKLGLMGTLEARKGKFIILSDLIWIKLDKETETPGGLYSSAQAGVNMFVWDPEVGYRVAETKAGSFDVLGGFRMMSIENNLNFRSGTLPGFDVSERKTFATPVIGGRGIINLSSKAFISTKFDVGGGIGADFTGQFFAGLGFKIKPKIALIGGWRYLKTDYDSNAGFVYDTTMNGLLLGTRFTF